MVAAEAAAVTVVVVAAAADIVKIINPISIEFEKVEPEMAQPFCLFIGSETLLAFSKSVCGLA
jgi:hypothetical protein